MVGPLETKEAAPVVILTMAMATLDARKAVTLGTILLIHGDLTLELTLRNLVLIHGDLTLRGALMLRTPVYKHGYAMLGPFLLPDLDVGMLTLQHRLGRSNGQLGHS